MTKDNLNQLIKQISGQVINRLQEKGIELNNSNSKPGSSNNNNKKGNQSFSEKVSVDGVVTAGKLEGQHSVIISKDSIVTPAARDYIREKGIQVEVVTEVETPSQIKESNLNNWYYWSSCPNIKIDTLGELPGAIFNISPVRSDSENIAAVVKELNQDILKGKVQGAILVVETSAKAVFLASRFENIRPVVGSCYKAVEEGIQQIGANLLILEHAVIGQTTILDMIRYFTIAERPNVSETLSKLETAPI